MKTLIVGLDCAAPELLFGDERLENIRRLMEHGCYGRLESVVPPITVPAWMCMSTSRDPGSLGVYGFRNRAAYDYTDMSVVTSRSIRQQAIWDLLAQDGKRSCVIGVPPGYPPRRINGTFVGCFMVPDTSRGDYTHPPEAAQEIASLCGDYPTDVKGFRTDDKEWLHKQTIEMTKKHFDVIRHFLKKKPWDHFQFVEIGLDRMHHGFWKHHDPQHRQHDPNSAFKNAIRDYYVLLDREIGSLLELVDAETAVAIVSDHGAQRLDGGFCVNEWLIREGLLVLHEMPSAPTPFHKLKVDWKKTKVWSEGGYYARIFLNIQGREPEGCIPKEEALAFREALKKKLEALPDDLGKPMGTLVYKPEEIYASVRNIAPDLIVHFGALYWRSIGTVGHGRIYLQENDSGPDDCNHAQFGAFVLAGPGLPVSGELEGAKLIDIVPTLLAMTENEALPEAQGRSLLGGAAPIERGMSEADEETVRERLKGLGYV